MKKIKLTLLFLGLIVLVICSSSIPKSNDFKKNYKKVSLFKYVGIHEVTNAEYREFVSDLKNKTEDYKKYYPDTTQWMKKFPNSFNEPFVEKYFWHPGLNNYPVVNISQDAAKKYCEWLSEKYNATKKRKFKKVTFRLPKEAEWNKFASVLPGHNLPWYGNHAYSPDSKCSNANVKFKNKLPSNNTYNYDADGSLRTCPIKRFKPNKIGLYDIIGNVAEITESGAIKGGSWDNTIEECMVNKTQTFQLPDPRVGFRVVMVVEEK